MEFAERLIALRKQKGYSQENLADMLDVSRQAVSKWESGASYPEIAKLSALSDIFGVSLDYLIKGKENEEAPQASPQTFGYPTYEYKSEATLFGLPLVHIHLGHGLIRAKGIIAIGNIATGFIAMGAISMGLISLGAISIGLLLSMGAIALSILLSIGAATIGLCAFGAVAVGYLAVGACGIGVYGVGASALARDIAVGAYARAHLAIGEDAKGVITHMAPMAFDEARTLMLGEFPDLWKPIADFLSHMASL